ncbi:MAG: DNA cytosine methyltransferase [Betaproteobacteria bacterium]|nr:DNA cytosine methyltransferase [Betaproteobacteria bacterium]
MIKVVDIFAGPGGLSEGISAVTDSRGRPVFEIVLSVEMDEHAYETLRLRTFFRQFGNGAPTDYYRYLRGEIQRMGLYDAHPVEAKTAQDRCWHAVLGPNGEPTHRVRRRIDEAVGDDTSWLLIGGPPCQAYSIAGRSRNQGNPDYDPQKDVRQRLYVEYLHILAEHRPAVFIMENVKGLLSATLENERIFHRILDDLRDPAGAIAREGRGGSRIRKGGYRIYSLTEPRMFENGDLRGSVIQAERYGIPQARHRVILLGVRDDIQGVTPKTLKPQSVVPASSVLNGLPRLRSGLSRIADSAEAWEHCLTSQVDRRWANAGTRRVDSAELSYLLRRTLRAITAPAADRGGEFVAGEITSKYAQEWFCDEKIGGVCNHGTRLHMESDLFRYVYASCYAKLHGISPSLRHFPTDLLPDHYSVDKALVNGGYFADRFRVQVGTRPSTTVVSHIGKDGHYYIHPDPSQCRSLTVREAARIQTFPDNYVFCGPKTAQYVQVGNAVPPLLAKQIGEIVFDTLRQAGANG